MTQENLDFLAKSRITIFSHAVGVTFGTVVLFGGGGYALDAWLGTDPWFLIIGLVLAFPTIQLVLYKKVRKLVAKND